MLPKFGHVIFVKAPVQPGDVSVRGRGEIKKGRTCGGVLPKKWGIEIQCSADQNQFIAVGVSLKVNICKPNEKSNR
jgi:hypothetical protein